MKLFASTSSFATVFVWLLLGSILKFKHSQRGAWGFQIGLQHSPLHLTRHHHRILPHSPLRSLAGSSTDSTPSFLKSVTALVAGQQHHQQTQVLLDFTDPATINTVDRLDDAIMGGISTSVVRFYPNTEKDNNNDKKENENSGISGYAAWSGVCREDGGGFCGWRTNPFLQLESDKSTTPGAGGWNVSGFDGFYVTCQLASDEDVLRRVWKISTRTQPGRGEQLYQAPMHWPLSRLSRSTTISNGCNNSSEWTTIQVPFDSFQLVRGPRIVPGGPPLDVTSTGIFQIGMTMSKFLFAGGENNTSSLSTLDDFRPGFFQLNMKEIGVYRSVHPSFEGNSSVSQQLAQTSRILSKQETRFREQRSLVLTWLVRPLLQLMFFSEASQRRKSALQKLMQRRGLTRLEAIRFGYKSRAHAVQSRTRALKHTMTLLLMDSLRTIVSLPLRILFLYPFRIYTYMRKIWNRRRREVPQQ